MLFEAYFATYSTQISYYLEGLPASLKQRVLWTCLLTFDPLLVALRFSHQQGCCLAIQGICGVRISQELWKEDLEDVDHIKHWRPGLIDHI